MSAVAQSRAKTQAQKPVERYSMAAPATVPNPATSVPLVPLPGEMQGQFFDRANRVLEGSHPEQIQRTAAILRLWQQSPNDANLRNKALTRFKSDEFTHQGPRCIFLSHTIPEIAEERDVTTGALTRPGREGTVYDRENLQHLVDYANYRILNAGQFAALSDGHMPTLAEKATGRPDAETVGWAGPFYIGLFGDVNPQWSIWADEWIHNEDVPRAKRLQRRSPEVWCKEPIERRTMDPIAMLGSETPRLDSGMDLYSLRSDGQLVMRYSMGIATALPGPTNCFVPGGEKSKKQNYGASEMAFPPKDDSQKPPDANPAPSAGAAPPSPAPKPAPAPGGPPAPGGADVSGVVEKCLQDLMPSIVQAVTDFINANDPNSNDAVPQEGQDDPSEDAIPRGIDAPTEDGPDGLDQAPNEAAAAPGGTPPSNDPMATQPPGGEAAPNPMAPPEAVADPAGNPGGDVPDDDQHSKYAAMGPDCGEAYAAGHAACQRKMTPKGPPTMATQAPPAPNAPTNYSKQFEDQSSLIKKMSDQIEAQRKQIEVLVQDKQDTERYSKVSKIIATRELPAEMTPETILAEAFEMADPEFDRYCKMLNLIPVKADAVETVFYDDPNALAERYSRSDGQGRARHTEADVQKYQRQAADMVVSINTKKGKGTTSFEEQWEIVAKANGIPV